MPRLNMVLTSFRALFLVVEIIHRKGDERFSQYEAIILPPNMPLDKAPHMAPLEQTYEFKQLTVY